MSSTRSPKLPDVELLIVDDDDELRSDMASFFSTRDCRVETCANGEEALAKADQRAFDVAILDVSMPGMSGLEALEKLKARGAECEVVMLTNPLSRP
jgi:CheY-like chemotaxis protein